MKPYVKKTKPALWTTLKPRPLSSPSKANKVSARASQKRRNGIRKRSKRMAKLMAYYRERKSLFLVKHPNCVLYSAHLATEIHHSRGRAGTLLLDERFWKPVCQSAHEFIHEEPEMARDYDMFCAHGNWNHPPKDKETERLKELIRQLTA